jgi:tetratricopeptide (TPR) repeat protein
MGGDVARLPLEVSAAMNLRAVLAASLFLSTPARGQDAVPPPTPDEPPAQGRPGAGPDDLTRSLAPNPNIAPSPAAWAGLPKDGPVVALNLARAFALAEGRIASQAGRDALSDAKALEGLIERGESLPIDRLKARLGQEAGEAAEPATPGLAGSYFAALRALSVAESSAQAVGAYERALEVFRELARGEAGGISQLQIDQVDLQLQQQRANLLTQRTRYRDALDELKQAIGLPPAAPIVLDPAALAGFDEFTRKLVAWGAEPGRDVADLDPLVRTLPELPEVRVGDAPLEDLKDEAAIGTALAGTAVAGDDAEAFRARAVIRSLSRLREQYDVDRIGLLVLLRQRDATLQRIVAPPGDGPPGGQAVMAINFITSLAGVVRAQEQLAQEWCQYQEQRLALQRLLGAFPYGSWDTFRDAYTARPAAPPSD